MCGTCTWYQHGKIKSLLLILGFYILGHVHNDQGLKLFKCNIKCTKTQHVIIVLHSHYCFLDLLFSLPSVFSMFLST